MAKGSPSSEQLLELLKRAAEELKSVRAAGEAAAAEVHKEQASLQAALQKERAAGQAALQKEQAAHQAAVQKEQAAHQALMQELQSVRRRLEEHESRNTDVKMSTVDLEVTIGRLRETVEKERARAVEAENNVAAVLRVRDGLQQQFEAAVQERDSLHERLAELDGAIRERDTLADRVAEAESASEAAREAAEARVAALELQLRQEQQLAEQKAIEAEGQLRADLGQEKENAIAAEREHAAAERAALVEAHETQLSAERGRAADAQASLTQEKEKHQETAKKLIETRSKVRELEATVSSEQERLKGLEAAAASMADQHSQELQQAAEAHAQALGALQSQITELQAQLGSATDNWRHVEHQYEVLHKEMLEILEQRDEARGLLDSERSERQRIERAFGQRR